MPDMNMMGGNMPQRPDNQEAAMARADLYKSANYSFKLFKMIQDGQELEGWVQAKITKAADYIASVYHYMEYEMKFNDYGKRLEDSDVYTESVKEQFKLKLTEARVKMEKLKKKNIKELDEEVDKSKIPAAQRKAKGGDWKVSKADLDKEASKSPTTKAGLDAKKKSLGMKEALKGGQKKLDTDKDGKLEKSDFAKLRAGKSVKEESHQSKTTMKHVKNPTAGEKQAAKDIKPGVKGYADRVAMLKSAEKDGRLKEAEDAQQGVAEGSSDPTGKVFFKVINTQGTGMPSGYRRVKTMRPLEDGGFYIELSTPGYGMDYTRHNYKNFSLKDDQGKPITGHEANNIINGEQGVAEGERTMSRAAKGHEKYGKAGMAALAKAGREGKNLDTVRKKYDKYDEAAKPDFLDMDKDGDKKEPMKKAVADKKAGPKKGVNPFAKKD